MSSGENAGGSRYSRTKSGVRQTGHGEPSVVRAVAVPASIEMKEHREQPTYRLSGLAKSAAAGDADGGPSMKMPPTR